ncbi:HAD-like domain-containing protein [Mycena rosella]|uniref:HAD-like domain-containing protein n=1 Tax=Mycena rosella TaxID=1033263 RepID=A0AAD7H1P0_MYCRO|nr:HAD-like domain-containing protein [Mycena rosella]
MPATSTFYADAVLFDMDGTLTDSISAVEAAWQRVAEELGLPPSEVIAQTHGKRAVDNLRTLKPSIKAHEMDHQVAAFETSILFYADAFHKYGPGSGLTVPVDQTSNPSSGALTPALMSDSGSSAASSGPSSRRPSLMDSTDPPSVMDSTDLIRPGFVSSLSQKLIATALGLEEKGSLAIIQEQDEDQNQIPQNELQAWQIEASTVDRSVQILPGVRRMLSSIPVGRYAVATSGAQTYAYGCMSRVGITPPEVTITADDKRLKAGKPAPDPFILAARCLGFSPSNCVVFEDSPSGIRAGVASGATVIAVCTSHSRAQIENCGAHYLVDDMRQVECTVVGQGEDIKLQFTIQDE